MSARLLTPTKDRAAGSVNNEHTEFAQKSNDYKPGLRGLYKYGNLCYMNSILQCLSHVELVKEFFCDFNPPTRNKNTSLTVAFSELIKEQWSKKLTSSPIDTRVIQIYMGQVSSRFSGSQQQDAYEFLITLIDAMHTELKTKEDQSIISELFQGEILSTVTCHKCLIPFECRTPFLSLQIPVPEKSATSSFYSPSSKVHLNDCMKSITNTFHYTGDNQWFCNYCKHPGLRNAERTLCLSKIPKVLIVQLQRFNIYSQSWQKIDTFVDYPLDELDLSMLMKGPQIGKQMVYELVGVSKHSGTLSSGHYTTFLKNHDNHRWYEFDDERVQEVYNSDLIKTPNAYILIYQQKSKRNTVIIDSINGPQYNSSKSETISSHQRAECCDLRGNFNNGLLGLRVLKNTGSLFHMNTALRCLSHIQWIKNYFCQKFEQSSMENQPLSTAFHRLMIKLWSNECQNDVVDPSDIEDKIEKLWARSHALRPADSHDLLIFLVNGLYNEMSNDDDRLHFERLLFIQIKSTTLCSIRSIPWLELKVPEGSSKYDPVKLQRCIREFLKPSRALRSSQKSHQLNSEEEFSLWKLPKVLIIKLSCYTMENQSGKNIDVFVEYPSDDLDLSTFLEDQQNSPRFRYDLIAVSNRVDNGIVRHHVTSIKHHFDGKWYQFNDKEVNELNNSGINIRNPCILIYRLKE